MRCPTCNSKYPVSIWDIIHHWTRLILGIFIIGALGYFMYIQNVDRKEYEKGIKEVLEFGKQNWVNKGYGGK